MSEVNSFTDLLAWQKNYEVVLLVYKLTQKFSPEEIYGLASQVRRSAASIIANIAEGYGRYHYKDKVKFYYLSRGSNTETQNHIILSCDLEYISKENKQLLLAKLIEGHKLINGLIKSTSQLI